MGHDKILLGKTSLAGTCILVVEDEFLIALEAQRIFQDAGAESVILANSVAKARGLLAKSNAFNIGFVDLKLGDEDALPLLDELARRDIPILVATGLSGPIELAGRTSLIRKPYHDADVLCAAHTLLAAR